MAESAPSVSHGSATLGGLRRRASSIGHVASHTSSADHGRAHPRGGPRGGAPRQRRRTNSSARRSVPQRSDWNDDTRTSGLFDVAFVRPSRLADTSVVNRTSFLSGTVVSARGGGSSGSGANASGRSTPGRSPHRSWASFHHSLLPSTAPMIPEPFHQEEEPSLHESVATNSDLVETSVGPSSVRMPSRVPWSERNAPPPGPVQLEVMHIQRSQDVPQSEDDICIVLPDGTSLGVGATIAANSEHETVVMLPGGAAVRHAPAESTPEEALSLEKPFIMADKARSVSEKLSLLLGSHDAPVQRKRHFRSVVAANCEVAPSKLLSGRAPFVLKHIDDLVSSVFDHVLHDTVRSLNSLPQTTSGRAVCSTTVDRASSPVEKAAMDKEQCRNEIGAASERLSAFERELALRYAGQGHPKDMAIPTPLGIASIGVRSSSLDREKITSRRGLTSFRTRGIIEERLPAALPLDRVREIEKYRTRFAHHCLAAREAGIDRSEPGDAVSVATWTIWPHIADSIALAVVESAIEEVHNAMERHVEELVAQEVGCVEEE